MSDTRSKGGAQAPGFFRFGLGAFEVVPLHDGVLSRDRPAGFVRTRPTRRWARPSPRPACRATS